MFKAVKQVLVDQVKTAAQKRGHHLIPDWKLANYPLVQHLRRLFAQYGIDCVLDVGGNQGQYRDLLRQEVGFEGWILSFEPVRKYVLHLQRRSQSDSKWKVFDFALGAEEGTANINVTTSPGLNSFLQPSTDALPAFWKNERSETEAVRIKKLDDFYEGLKQTLGFQSPYLKLDTQGFDLEVTKGALNSLKDVRALQTEASVQAIYTGMPDWRESVRTMESHGFELSAMFPVTQDNALRLVEFDCVMINCEFSQRVLRRA